MKADEPCDGAGCPVSSRCRRYQDHGAVYTLGRRVTSKLLTEARRQPWAFRDLPTDAEPGMWWCPSWSDKQESPR